MQSIMRIPGRSASLRHAKVAVEKFKAMKDGHESISMGRQKSDYLIVVLKLVKASGAKGITSKCNSKTKHGWHKRSNKS